MGQKRLQKVIVSPNTYWKLCLSDSPIPERHVHQLKYDVPISLPRPATTSWSTDLIYRVLMERLFRWYSIPLQRAIISPFFDSPPVTIPYPVPGCLRHSQAALSPNQTAFGSRKRNETRRDEAKCASMQSRDGRQRPHFRMGLGESNINILVQIMRHQPTASGDGYEIRKQEPGQFNPWPTKDGVELQGSTVL